MFSQYTEDLLHDTNGLPISCGPSPFMGPAYESTVLCSGMRIDYLANLRGASFKTLPDEQLTLRPTYCLDFQNILLNSNENLTFRISELSF